MGRGNLRESLFGEFYLNGEHIQAAWDELKTRISIKKNVAFLTHTPELHIWENEKREEGGKSLIKVVRGDGIEPPTRGFSVLKPKFPKNS